MLPLSLEEGKPYEFSGMENWAPWLPFTAAPIALPPLSGEQNDTSPVISSPRAHPIFPSVLPFSSDICSIYFSHQVACPIYIIVTSYPIPIYPYIGSIEGTASSF
jgi:hypothetical protein